jgi:mono/diheme cytochrome c family protein
VTHRILLLASLLILVALSCYAPEEPLVKSRILPNDSVEQRVRRAANGEAPAKAETMPAQAATPAAPASPKTPPAPSPTPAAAPVVTASAKPDPAEGKKLYAVYCSSCHGMGGAGDGPAAAGLNPKPAKHTDGSYMNGLSNDHLYLVIEKGGTAVGKSALMTPWGSVMSEKQIWDVVAFTRSLAVPPYTGPGV